MDSLQEVYSHLADQDVDRRLASYLACAKHERQLLQVLAVACQPIDAIALGTILNLLGWNDQRSQPLTTAAVERLCTRLLNAGLVLREGSLLRCHPDILEVPARELAAAGTFTEIAQTASRVLPIGLTNVVSGDDFAELRRLRNALYQGQIDEVLSQLDLDQTPHKPCSYGEIAMLIRVCLRPLDLGWFDNLPEVIRFQVLTTLLNWSARFLQEQNWAYERMEQGFGALAVEHRTVAYALAEQRLYRGRLEGLEALLDEDDHHQALTLLGWLRFLQGQYDAAVECFQAAVKRLKGRSRRHDFPIRGLPGVFHVLALMQRGRRPDLDAAHRQIMICANAVPTDSFEAVFRVLADCEAVLRGGLRADDAVWLQRRAISVDPYLELFRCLALRWVGAKPRATDIDKLFRYRHAARQSGIFWYARESAELLAALGTGDDVSGNADDNHAAAGVRTILDLIERHEPWELALQALQGIGRSANADAQASAVDQRARRMVWHLNCQRGICTLEPREQKRNKRGQWSQGRTVALQRLHRPEPEFDYLTPQDRQICAHIVQVKEYGYFGRSQRTGYQIDYDKALLAAVGHPLLFRPESPELPVELVPAAPVLEVAREQGWLRIRIEPLPVRDAALVAQEDGANRIRLVKLEPEHLQISEILGPDGLRVPISAEKQVLESIAATAPLLNVHSDISGGAAGAETVPADSRPRLHLQPAGDGLRLELYVQPFVDGGPLFRPGQGSATVFAEVDSKPLQTDRDLRAEQEAVEIMLSQCPCLERLGSWNWVLDDPDSALETLSQLQELGEAVVLEWPKGQKISLSRKTGLHQMQVSVRKQRDWFSLDGGLHLDDGRVLSMQQVLALLEQSPGRFVRLGEDQFLQLSQELRTRLDAIRNYSDNGRFHALAAPVIDEAIGGMPAKAGKPWKELLARMTQAQALQPQIPSTLQAELRDYQADGYRWVARLAHWGAGACLADDMGLGKTIQALALILTRAPQGPTLVLAPTSVCTNWLEEADRFAPTLRPVRFGPGERKRMLDEAGPYDLVVCSYGLLQSEADRLAAVGWHTIVADEAQAIKNSLTKRSRAAMKLTGDFRMITTGTPIENHLGELWNLFRFINPGLLGSQEHFKRRFAIPIEERKEHEARQRLKRLIRPFMLRRLKSEVLSELPPRTEITLHVELNGEEATLYEAMRRQALERMAEPADHVGHHRIRMLTEITKLRRVCCHPRLIMPESAIDSSKLRAFSEILEELLENRHKALVFSQFVDHLSLIRAHLNEQGIRYQYLDGSTPPRQRKQAVDAFQAGEGELFLISLKAGGVGLNLTAADYVIHMDPWWNPAVEDQASDRAHRIGQERPVTVYRLVASNTIEEKIVDLHRHKRDLADSLLEGADAGARLSVEDMMALIRDESVDIT